MKASKLASNSFAELSDDGQVDFLTNYHTEPDNVSRLGRVLPMGAFGDEISLTKRGSGVLTGCATLAPSKKWKENDKA